MVRYTELSATGSETSGTVRERRFEKIFEFCRGTGEGHWMITAAIEEIVPANVLTAALYARFRSREKESFSDKLLSAMRHKF
jgi:6-phosphogluconate dehydrogenase